MAAWRLASFCPKPDMNPGYENFKHNTSTVDSKNISIATSTALAPRRQRSSQNIYINIYNIYITSISKNDNTNQKLSQKTSLM